MNKKTTTKKEFKTSKKVSILFKNITLKGIGTLRAEKVTSTYKVIHELHPKTHQPFKIVYKELIDEQMEPLYFDLVEITPEELDVYRSKEIPSFVLKVDGKLYYTSIPDNLSFVSSTILGEHKCSAVKRECRRLSAASDENGGCAKVRNYSQCIERYPWISVGFESFNTKHDSFVVISCSNYRKCPPKKLYSAAERSKAKISLAQFLWDDVETISDVKAKIEKNHDNQYYW